MHNLYRRSPLGLALLCLFASHPLTAQSQATADTVVVTASRFPERALDAPIGTRIITAEDIENSTANTVQEVLQKLGGVHLKDSLGSRDPMIDLRGFGITGDDNTLVLLDGVRIERIDQSTRPLSGIPLQMIERIEILPGSGAVLYGAGATGGTINIITKSDAQKERSLTLFGGAGTHNTKEARVIGRVGGEELGLTLSGTHFRSDNYRDNNDVEQTSGMGDFTWRRGDHRASLRFGSDRQTVGLPGPRTEAQLKTDRRGTNDPHNWSRIESSFATLSGATRYDAFEFSGDVGYREGTNDSFYAPSYRGHAEYDNWSVSPRMRWSSALFDMPLQLITGIDWYQWDWETQSGSRARQESRSLYLQTAVDVTTSTRVDLGWRAQRLETEQDDSGAQIDQVKTLYANEIGLRQELSSAWSAHLKTGRSFRVANVDENFGRTDTLLKPQTSRQNEVGVQYVVRGLRVAATAYDMKLENEIVFMPFVGPWGQNINLPPTRRRGAELAVSWQATPTLEAGLRAQWQRATFRRGVYGGVDVSGNEVPLVPKRLISLHADWEFLPGTKLSGNYIYVGPQRYDNDQVNRFKRMPSYGLVDLRLSHEVRNWTVALNVENVFDKDYYNYALVSHTFTTFTAYPQAGRTFFVSAEYRFR